jgi:hypothetical protein
MNIKIIDNFLPKEEFVNLQNVVLSDWFPWYKLNFKINSQTMMADSNLEKYNLQFIHTFYKEHASKSDFLQYLNPILTKLNPLAIIRLKANLSTATSDIVEFGLHQDVYDSRITTGIYYFNTNNGYTFFDDGTNVQSIENRLVLFNSQMLHSGTTCTDEKFRCVLNLNFIEG